MCETTLPSMLTKLTKHHEEELTQVLTQHASPKSAYAGPAVQGFAGPCYDTTLAWDVTGGF